jgi:hypothetical protein
MSLHLPQSENVAGREKPLMSEVVAEDWQSYRDRHGGADYLFRQFYDLIDEMRREHLDPVQLPFSKDNELWMRWSVGPSAGWATVLVREEANQHVFTHIQTLVVVSGENPREDDQTLEILRQYGEMPNDRPLVIMLRSAANGVRSVNADIREYVVPLAVAMLSEPDQ